MDCYLNRTAFHVFKMYADRRINLCIAVLATGQIIKNLSSVDNVFARGCFYDWVVWNWMHIVSLCWMYAI